MNTRGTRYLALAGAFLVSVGGVGIAQQARSKPGDERTSDAGTRMIRREVIVAGSLAEVWRAWTTTEGVTSFFGPEADIELAVGGKYEIYFSPTVPEGSRGSEGCKVLAYLPKSMLAFSWNAPPSIPELRRQGPLTQVIVQLEQVNEDRVKVAIRHHGIGEGEKWDEYLAYFERAWTAVLGELQERFAMTQAEGSAREKQKAGGSQQFAYFIRPSREGFFEQPTEFEATTVSEHADYVKRLLERGTVFLAGRCFDPPYYPESSKDAAGLEMPTPGIVLFTAESLTEAKRIMEADPAVRTGVFKARLNSFRKAFAEE